jgi:hypothetical protein
MSDQNESKVNDEGELTPEQRLAWLRERVCDINLNHVIFSPNANAPYKKKSASHELSLLTFFLIS